MCSELAFTDEQPLPTEFRVFRRGLNETSKGSFIFDDEAAREVLAAYQREGVDQIIDLEHYSFDEEIEKTRADAKDARGYYRLELRNGELWASGVSWAADGERRLRERTQRYISPAFLYDKETRKFARLLNCGLVSMPATYDAEPLVASRDALAHVETPARAGSLAAINAATRELARQVLRRVPRK